MRTRAAGAVIGVVFGFTLCWSGMSDPNVIREALLFQAAYLFLMFAAAVAVATAGVHLLRRGQLRALLTGAPLGWVRERPARRHVTGSVLFGIGDEPLRRVIRTESLPRGLLHDPRREKDADEHPPDHIERTTGGRP